LIPYGRQDISAADIAAVVKVLESDYLTQGPQVPKFETAVADKLGAGHALAVNSATSALHIACMALGLGPNDVLWTSPITFVASANCGRYCGASVDFVDIDPATYNLSIVSLESKLELAQERGQLPKVLVAVHMCGQPCDMVSISRLSKRYGFKVIEDASHAIGGKYKGNYIGNCRYSDITIFSFHPVKIITTGEGGMAITNDLALAKKMDLYRGHGITRDSDLMTREPDGPWYYQQLELGYNYRMTELQGTLGLSQLDRLDSYVSRRQELANRYHLLLSELPLILPWQHSDGNSGWHLYVVRLQTEKIAKSQLDIFRLLRSRGIGVNVHYIPVHMQPYYANLGHKTGDFPNAELYYKEAISLPLFPTLSIKEQDQIVSTLTEVLLT
jgi:UDP-4-amino-4,6-dideoxy-N-acetyl-beta-L-altrosamine transaminase